LSFESVAYRHWPVIPAPNGSSITLSSADGLQEAHCPARGWERAAESKPSLGRRHEAKAWKRRMNRDGIKIAWKIDRKAASARSVPKENHFTGSKTGWRAAKRLGFRRRLSFYGRVILSYALRARHIVTGCFGTIFAPALTQFSVMPELPNLRDFPNPDSIERVSPRTAWLTSCFA